MVAVVVVAAPVLLGSTVSGVICALTLCVLSAIYFPPNVSRLKRVLAGGLMAVALAGTVAVYADTPYNPYLICRGLDPNENWFLWWYYDCDSAPKPPVAQ